MRPTQAQRDQAIAEAAAGVLADLRETHHVIPKEEFTVLLQRTAVAYLEEGYNVAVSVVEAVHKGGTPVGGALKALDYAANDGGILEVANEQARDSVELIILNHERSAAAKN